MVTNINVPLDDTDYKKIIEAKGEMTWREVLFEWYNNKTNSTINSKPPSIVR